MATTKCEACGTFNQGFHLCLGRKVTPNQLPYLTAATSVEKFGESAAKSAAAMQRWQNHWDENKARDEAILKMYSEGYSFRHVGEHFGISKPSARNVVIRMGGTPRKSQGRPR